MYHSILDAITVQFVGIEISMVEHRLASEYNQNRIKIQSQIGQKFIFRCHLSNEDMNTSIPDILQLLRNMFPNLKIETLSQYSFLGIVQSNSQGLLSNL